MAFDCGQFRRLVHDILRLYPELASPAAENLLLGTAAQESVFGTYLYQINGPALGVFQMEPGTYQWICNKYSGKYQYLFGRPPWELPWNLKLAILTARLRYRVVADPLPEADDIDGLAAYWKQNYNSPAGKGTIEQFIANYRKYVKEE